MQKLLGSFGFAIAVAVLLTTSVAVAENEGQADLDMATEAKLEAESLADLEKVAGLCDSALKKGLDAENAAFANQLLSSVLMQHAQKLCQAIFEQQPPDRRWQLIRSMAMKDLERAVKADPKSAEAHLLIVKLQILPGGDPKLAKSSIDEAVKVLNDDKPQLAKALVLRAQLKDDPAEQMADYEAALQADPRSVEALQFRSRALVEKGDFEKAVADLLKLLEIDSNNLVAQGSVAEVLANLKRYDEALAHVEKVIKLNPSLAIGYQLRAQIRSLQEKYKEAIEDLDTALKLEPRDARSYLLRSRLHVELNQLDKAKEDIEQALKLQPDLTQGLLMRSMIAAQSGKLSDAISDLKSLLQADPSNVELRLQLAAFYNADGRPRKAVEVCSQILESDEDNVSARRTRADALLSVGEHAKAITDYDIVIKAEPKDSHTLNNLAWVLSTSTEDAVRNGKRAIEIAQRACEATEYKKPHILSTLASAYAETGDFETAIKWSTKAVELSAGDGEISDQLKKELESYKEKKPWREKQNTEEKKEEEKKKTELEA